MYTIKICTIIILITILAIESDQEQESDFEDVDSEAQEDQIADLEDGESEQSNADMEIESNQIPFFSLRVYCIYYSHGMNNFRNGCGSKQ